MSEAVQLAWVQFAEHIAEAIVAAAGLMGAAWVSRGKVLTQIAEIHKLTNSTSTAQLAQIEALTKQVAILTNAASVKTGIDIGIQQQKDVER